MGKTKQALEVFSIPSDRHQLLYLLSNEEWESYCNDILQIMIQKYGDLELAKYKADEFINKK